MTQGRDHNPQTTSRLGQNCACFNLRKAARLATQVFDQRLKPCRLRATQFSLLAAASSQPGLRIGRLADIMGMDRTTLTRNLGVLEKRDLVTVEPGEDRREHRVRLTAAGSSLLAEALPLWELAQEEVTAGLGDDWPRLLSDLHRLNEMLS